MDKAHKACEVQINQNEGHQDLTLESTAEDFFRKSIALRGMSPATVEAYTRDFRDFGQFLDSIGIDNNIAIINADILEDFFANCKGRGVSINTVHRKKDAQFIV